MNPEEIKAKQAQLKALGLYLGPLDGKMGPDTAKAIASLEEKQRQKQADDRNAAARTQEIEAKKAEAETARAQAEAAKVKAESDRAIAENDPTSRATKMALEVSPYLAGGTVGKLVAGGMNKAFASADAGQTEQASRLAKALQIDPAVKQGQLDKMNRGRSVRNAAQFAAPLGLLAAGTATRELIAPGFEDPAMREIVKNVGTGENAAGITMGISQLLNTLKRGNPIDPVDEASIRSDAARAAMSADDLDRSFMDTRKGPSGGAERLQRALSASPAPVTAPTPTALPAPAEAPVETIRNGDRLKQAAKAAGASGPINKSVASDHLIANLNEGNRAAVAKALGVSSGPNFESRIKTAIKALASKPGSTALAAAAVAAGMTMGGSAEAADGTAQSLGDQVGDAATAGGAAGATAYGVSKLAPGAMSKLMNALGVAGVATAPFSAADLSDEYAMDDQQKARDRNWIARNIPGASYLPGEIGKAAEMSQVPTRGDRSPEAMAARTQSDTGSELDGLLMAAEQDPELAAMLRDVIQSRLSEMGSSQMALASQSAAQSGDPLVAALRNSVR